MTILEPAAAKPLAAPAVAVKRTEKGTSGRGAAHAAAASPSSTCQAYNPQLCSVLAVGASGTGAGAGAGAGGSGGGTGGGLPFTGLDLVLLACLGGSLAALGVLMRRLSRAAGGIE